MRINQIGIMTFFLVGIEMACIGPVVEQYREGGLKIEVISKTPLQIGVSGISGNSSRRVKDVVVHQENSELNVQVLLTLGKGTGTGEYRKIIDVKDGINSVTFGKEHALIWRR
jgi:hypothetical protein